MRMEIRGRINGKGLTINAGAVRKPKFSSHGGRSWDSVHAWIKPENYGAWMPMEIRVDTTWGKNGYFKYDGTWYAVPTTILMELDVF